MKNLKEIADSLQSLVIFKNLSGDKVLKLFPELCGECGSAEEKTKLYVRLVAALYDDTDNFSAYVRGLVLEDENAYILRAGAGTLTENYKTALEREISMLGELCLLTSENLKMLLHIDSSLPDWSTDDISLADAYRERVSKIGSCGYGMWAKYHVFCLKGTDIVPVKYPDPQRLSDFSGYENERSKVIANTRALLAGLPCNNVLLYGDAGSGKSSTVKAIANEFKGEGLRLVEVKKNQLYSLPDVLDALSGNPLKFIIFIDDLSFSGADEDFGALKAILEGSTTGKSHNIAIYATSNRRHLVKESFRDREGDDIHRQDTIQELTSLSARFGLKVTFSRPDKNLYSSIICDLARQSGIDMPEDELIMKAEAHAIRNGGRSPRTAKQFIDYLSYTLKER